MVIKVAKALAVNSRTELGKEDLDDNFHQLLLEPGIQKTINIGIE